MKQRVLIVNKFYYTRGGDCVCTLNLEKMLSAHGHETAVYAMNHPDNNESEWSRYFASQVQFCGGISSLLKATMRTLGLGDIRKSFKRILDDFKPDVVHLNNIHSYLSPVLASMAKKSGAKVVWTMHDYKLICPSYSCMNNGSPCEKCYINKWNVISNRCMKGSIPASVIAWLEAKHWNRRRLEEAVDHFICPSEFMNSKMKQAGFSSHKLTTLCNFIDPVKLTELSKATNNDRETSSYCYIGRLSREKGIAELLETASQMPAYNLYIAGDGPLANELKCLYTKYNHIHFMGHLNAENIIKLLKKMSASIIPSRWHENNPLGVIESLCAGTPVIGARIGGIPELIDTKNGVTYQWNDQAEMHEAITFALSCKWDNDTIATESIKRFGPEEHYRKLTAIYKGNS